MRLVRCASVALSAVLLPGCSQEFRTVSGTVADAALAAPRASQVALGDAEVTVARTVQPLGDASTAPRASGVTSEAREPDAGGGPRTIESEPTRVEAGTVDSTTSVDASSAPPPAPPCTTGKAGPPMARIPEPGGSSYCIDTTEVTVSDYAAFLAANPPLSLLPAGVCAWKKSFVPDGVFPPSGDLDLPVASVDWCDAAAYCVFAGKHLCGKAGGGTNAYSDYAKPASEWYFACTSGGKTTYPYGSAFDPSACVGVDFDGTSGFQPATDLPHDVGAALRCHGQTPPFDALHDMAGNVAEWEDSCDSTGGSADYCHVRGDSYREGNASTMSCAYAPRLTRSYRAAYVGFRCCSES